jgi:flagellar basal body-associated protein FliL
MQWQPQKPPSHRTRLLAIAIVAIPVTLIVVGTLVLLWQLLGQASSGM